MVSITIVYFFFYYLLQLNLSKVAIETKENMEPSSERLKARNVFFYIKYKYHANQGRDPKRHLGHKTRDRIAA